MQETVAFRNIKKERIAFQVPPEIATLVRQMAVTERTSISQVGTTLFVKALGLDPQPTGVKPRKPKAKVAS